MTCRRKHTVRAILMVVWSSMQRLQSFRLVPPPGEPMLMRIPKQYSDSSFSCRLFQCCEAKSLGGCLWMRTMANLQSIPKEPESVETSVMASVRTVPVWQWVLGAVLVVVFGSWLVWLSAYLQRMFIEGDIRAACERVMPDTVQRCVDTVIIQRGGARR